MKHLSFLSCLLLITANQHYVLAQKDTPIEVQAVNVSGNIYMIAGTNDATAFSGGNIGISVGEDGVFMIDAKMAFLGDKIKDAIKKLGGSSPKFIVNTHVHGDHVSGNSEFSKHGTVIAHTNVRKRLVTDKPREQWPVITFDRSLSFHLNGEEIQVLHYPKGHTDGDAIIYFTKSNVVHMGDHYFSGLLPFVDLDNGGSVQGYVSNVKKVIDKVQDDAKIIPGHGPLSSTEDLRTYYRMLQETTEMVTSQMKSGKSLEEIKKGGLQEEWKSWSWGFINTEKWIETIYKSYSAEMTNK